ncbi:helicase [Candidatus Pacearchaeota archaeon]|jgi:superfamily II DNA or RNA helicase|nr:helicase [Candidatus Pacearchaeota archaeon]
MNYEEFLKSKQFAAKPSGFEAKDINPKLFGFQRDIVSWGCHKGRACVFAGTGLGKTPIQLEWADQVYKHSGGNVLILAPLAVAQQTVEEGAKFGTEIHLCRKQEDVLPGINITNYEMLDHFDPKQFSGVVLDESSIIKSFEGAVRTQIIESFQETPYKLACTATPAPNDHMELGNHAEFMGVMSRTEMLSAYFVHDGGKTSQWRLKGHAKAAFWRWVATWAVMLQMPSDLGYEDNGFKLPPLNIDQIVVDRTGYIVKEALTLQDRRGARKNSLDQRVVEAARIATSVPGPWLVWCDLNVEADALKRAIPGSVEIRGSDDPEKKAQVARDFANGNINILISKSSIFGFGLNFQCCHRMIFTGISDSFEQYYQAVRRCWRFGQKEQVDVYVITSEAEGAVVKNIKRKEKEFESMLKGMIAETQEITKANLQSVHRETDEYKQDAKKSDLWDMRLGDCCEEIKNIESDSIHYIIFSPPFSSLYTYSNSPRDLGNCKDDLEFFAHFDFLASDLFRILMPGRLMSVHCMNLPTSKQSQGVIGIRDFRGDLIRIFQAAGFIYHSEVCIWKDPVTAMQRTKALGLLHKQLKKDSCMSRQGIPDYLVTFRKPGDNPERVTHTNESFPVKIWQNYASPIWMDINPSETLQRTSAREDEDERHIAPLQLQVIRRGLELWTNPGDLVFSPFAGIGSEGYEAVKNGRKFIGIELKESYYQQACKNLKRAEFESKKPEQIDLFKFEKEE